MTPAITVPYLQLQKEIINQTQARLPHQGKKIAKLQAEDACFFKTKASKYL